MAAVQSNANLPKTPASKLGFCRKCRSEKMLATCNFFTTDGSSRLCELQNGKETRSRFVRLDVRITIAQSQVDCKAETSNGFIR